jgi:hypothetical protein
MSLHVRKEASPNGTTPLDRSDKAHRCDGGANHDRTGEVGYHTGLHGYAPLYVGEASADRSFALDLVPDMGLGEEAIAAHCVETHQDGNVRQNESPGRLIAFSCGRPSALSRSVLLQLRRNFCKT